MPPKTRRTESAKSHPVAIDTETTGKGHHEKPPRRDAILQVGLAYRNPGGQVVTWFECCNPGPEYLKPGFADEALRVNELTRDQILKSPPPKEVADRLRAKLQEIAKEVGVPLQLLAYNRDFDQPFLTVKPWEVPSDLWGPCVMLSATEYLDGPDARWVGLAKAMQRLRIDWPGRAHNAATDSHAALLVWEEINKSPAGPRVKSSPSRGPQRGLEYMDGCELCENGMSHDEGVHGYFQEGDFYEFG